MFYDPKQKTPSIRWRFLFILFVYQDVLHAAIEDGTKIPERHGTDGLVVLETVKKTAADIVIHDQAIRGYASRLQCFVKRLI